MLVAVIVTFCELLIVFGAV
jgi:hypothetical protein